MENRNWKEYKIKDIAEVIGGGTPRTDNPDFWNGDIPWITPRDLTGYSKMYISNGERFISSEGLKGSSTRLLPKGTVLLTSRAPIGYVAIADNEICTNQGFKSLVLSEDLVYNKFIYYWIKNNIDYLQSIGTGTTFAEISGNVVKEIDIQLPPLPEQKAIASVLSSLDDKIDLLHQQNQTLEALAETLFRQWFIEEAKEDWEEGSLGSMIDLVVDNRGKTPPTVEYKTEFPLIEVNAINTSDCLVNYNVIRKYVVEETYNTWFRKHLNVNDVIVSTVGTIGVFSIFTSNIGCIAQNLIGLRSETISPYFIYLFLKTNKEDILNLDIGGVQPSIKVPHLLDLKLKKPTIEVINKFHNLVKEYFNKIGANQQQIQTLTQLRDTLLPKLMSGEVRVQL